MALTTAPILLVSTILVHLFFTSSSQTCSNHTFKSPKAFNSCKDLPYLNAHLHWTYFESTKQVQIAFRAKHAPKGWTAWAINPYRRAMVGSQALIAFRDGQGKMSAYTTIITGYNPKMQPMKLGFCVSKLSAAYENGEMIIFAVVGPLVNGPVVNHVWQVGSLDPNGVPQMHEMEQQNLESTGVVDFSYDHKFTSRRVYSSCRDLPRLYAHLYWTYDSATGQAQIAYRARQGSRGWVAWAINPNQTGMVGSEALVAFHNSNGSMTVYSTLITSYSPSMLPGELSFQISSLSAEYSSNEITIFAVVGPFASGSRVNQVWQAGSLVLDGIPQMHAVSQQNLQSTGELDFLLS